jgi:hypothetical protein
MLRRTNGYRCTEGSFNMKGRKKRTTDLATSNQIFRLLSKGEYETQAPQQCHVFSNTVDADY